MPSSYTDMPARLRGYGITRHTLGVLRIHHDYVLAALPEAVRAFFDYVTARPQLAALFPTPEIVAHVHDRQLAHWALLVRGDLGAGYVASVLAMGRTHNRIGLPPKVYIEGYNQMLKTAGQALAARRRDRGVRAPDISALLAIQQALTAVMMMDMDYVIEVYEDSAKPLLF